MTQRHVNRADGSAGSGARRGPHLVLLTGWNWFNTGDIAHTPGFLRLVEQQVPDAEVTVLASAYPDELDDYLSTRFDNVRAVLPAELLPGRPLSTAMVDTFATADFFVVNSGMTLSYGYYGHDWSRYISRILHLQYAQQQGVPCGVWGHSFDRIDPPADVLYRPVFAGSELLLTRDTPSLRVLDAHGLTARVTAFCPDSTFSFDLHRRVRQTPGELLDADLPAGDYLTFVPRLDVNRFRPGHDERSHADRAVRLITRWVRERDTPVVIVHETEPGIRPAAELIMDRLPPDVTDRVVMQPDYWESDRCQRVIAGSRLLVSQEMHSVIMGIAAGVPSVHWYFAEAGLKQWMIADLGVPEWLFDIDVVDVEEVADTVLALADHPVESRARAEAVADRALALQRRYITLLAEIAADHRAARIEDGAA